MKRELTDAYLRSVKPRDKPFRVWDTRQLALCARVQPTGSISFLVWYRSRGKLRWFTVGRYGKIGVRQARQIAATVLAKAQLGKDPQARKMRQREGDSLATVHDAYLATIKDKNKSWPQADKLMRTYVLPTLGKRKVKDITRADVWKLFDSLSDRKSLANQVLAAASARFSWAVQRDLIAVNPCQGIERNVTASATRFLSNDEIRQIWPLLDDLGLYQGTMLKIVLLTGQRPGEVCAMRHEHIKDHHGRWWQMPGAKTDTWPGTKNGRDHEIFLTEPVLELLRELEPHKSPYIFPSRAGYIKIPVTQPIWTKAGISRFRPHDLRATCATQMDALGINRQHISLILNHVEGGVTASYVRHDQRDHKRAALEAWAKELLAILAGEGATDHKADVIALRA